MERRAHQPIGTGRRAPGFLCKALAFALASWTSAARAEGPDKTAEPGAAHPSGAQPSRTECLEAHRNAQELKQTGKLIEAQEHLLVCSAGTCPGAIISDCGNWISQLEQMTPSMVFEIKADGKQALDAKLFVDEKPVEDWSQAVKVNPGRHVVRVEVANFPPREEQIVLPEGQRMRLISIEFASERPSAEESVAPPPKDYKRPVPFIVYPLLAVGVGGLASFGVFSYLGRAQQDKLERICEPRCTDDDMETMRQNYLVGDISAGVGAAALLGASIVYFTRPRVEVGSNPKPATGIGRLGVQVGAGSIGVSITRLW
jgi:hypothetical protein